MNAKWKYLSIVKQVRPTVSPVMHGLVEIWIRHSGLLSVTTHGASIPGMTGGGGLRSGSGEGGCEGSGGLDGSELSCRLRFSMGRGGAAPTAAYHPAGQLRF